MHVTVAANTIMYRRGFVLEIEWLWGRDDDALLSICLCLTRPLRIAEVNCVWFCGFTYDGFPTLSNIPSTYLKMSSYIQRISFNSINITFDASDELPRLTFLYKSQSSKVYISLLSRFPYFN